MRHHRAGILCWAILLAGSWALAEKRPLTVQDIMKFREIHDAKISEDGRWLAYEARPDRGDGEGRVHSIDGEQAYSVERGSRPVFAKDSRWVALRIEPSAAEKEKAKKKAPPPGMALLQTASGKQERFERVESFSFSDDSAWLAYQRSKDEKSEEKKENQGEAAEGKKDAKKEDVGTTLVLRRLNDGSETEIPHVRSYAFDPDSRFLVYAVAAPGGESNGLRIRDLGSPGLDEATLASAAGGRYTRLAWSREGSRLAFVAAADDDKGKPGDGTLRVWEGEGEAREAVSADAPPEGWRIPSKNNLAWSRDGQRIFFGLGLRPEPEDEEEEGQGKDEAGNGDAAPDWDPYDVEALLKERELDVWHWNDPLISPNRKELWPRIRDHLYTAVYHLDSGKMVPLTDEKVPDLRQSENPHTALAISNIPYQKEITWNGRFWDAYVVDLQTGRRQLAARKLPSPPQLSPQGRYLAYFEDDHWHLFDRQSGAAVNLTAPLQIPFYDEDHDYPSSRPSYDLAGWLENDAGVLINDKYDIWKFPLPQGDPVCLTRGQGRRSQRTFRAIQTDPEALFFKPDEPILLRSYHQKNKNYGFYLARADEPLLQPLLEEEKRFEFVAKAAQADVILYTREDYTEFPDMWAAGKYFDNPRRITQLNPQIEEFAWGEEELVEWRSLDGIPLQGVLIKPGNYQPGKRYPVLVYFYRFFSQRLHEFNQMVVNHRPNFPFYASNGYAVFLPDIRFEVGRPGFSATKCLVPGVQKLIDMGIADPKAVGLHGHSWSGYQTAFVITQTDIFAAAAAGAPVSNMTSAYSGIRWGTGLARQFQYEKSQSRIGGSLWEYPERYIENSPVFFADRIRTPLLIEFGDEDGAVPWYQGIELYLAMRRLEKPCIFLQYRGEPHHLQKYPNKVDYTLKMKQFFDHYLKGEPAPKWMTEGEPYRGK